MALTLSASTPGFAQAQDPAHRSRARGARAQGVRPAELTAMLDAYAIVQAQTALQLTDAQYGPFVTRLKRLQENRRRSGQPRNRLLQDLRLMIAPDATADENAMRDRLRALRDHPSRLRRRCSATPRPWTRCSTSGSRPGSGCSRSGSNGRSSTS